jgi:superfamily II DNA/RNA helicase
MGVVVPPRALQFAPAPYDATPVPFKSLGLNPHLERALADRFVMTTPIQSAVYPGVFERADLVACAQTGTGKTLAFLLPLMHRLIEADTKVPAAARSASTTRVLILAPTRELAVQIEDEFQGLAYHTHLSSVAVYGGVEAGPRARPAWLGDIVVATPGGCSIIWAAMGNFDAGSAHARQAVGCLTWASGRASAGLWPRCQPIVRPCSSRRQCPRK